MNPASGPSPPSIAAQLDRLLASRTLSPSERLSNFLRFVVEKSISGEASEIKEYSIGTSVYGRPPSFDPKADSIVRVEASRLRTKLREFYDTEGRDDPVRIELPKGTYAPVFTFRPLAQPAPVEPPKHDPPSQSRVKIVLWALTGVVLLAFIAHRMMQPQSPGRMDVSEFSSVAIAPFLNLTPNSQRDFTGKLMAEIKHAMAQIKDLRVASLSNAEGNLSAIRKDLHAGSVLEGDVQQEGGMVRVHVRLISTIDGYSLWSAAYDRTIAENLDLQTKLASEISTDAAATLARLSADAAGGAAQHDEALSVFRKGTDLLDWNRDHLLNSAGQLSESGIRNAIDYFENAVKLNPRYARVHAALAHSYAALADNDPSLVPKMRAAALRALQLDDNIASAHAILGYTKFLHDWDFPGAEREFQRALQLQPRLLGVYRLYGDTASLLGHNENAWAEMQRGSLIFPDSPLIATAKALVLFHWRRYRQSAAEARAIQVRHPNYTPAHWLLGLALEQQGRLPEASAEFEKSLALAPGDLRATIALGHVQVALGRRRETLALIEDFRANAARKQNAPYAIALLRTALGEPDLAFLSLDEAFRRRDNSLPYMKLDPRFDPIRKDPRFTQVLKELGLDRSF